MQPLWISVTVSCCRLSRAVLLAKNTEIESKDVRSKFRSLLNYFECTPDNELTRPVETYWESDYIYSADILVTCHPKNLRFPGLVLKRVTEGGRQDLDEDIKVCKEIQCNFIWRSAYGDYVGHADLISIPTNLVEGFMR